MQLNPEVQPKVLLPQYQIPAAILAVADNVAVDAASEEHDEPEVKVMAIKRTYKRARSMHGGTIRNAQKHGRIFWPTLAQQGSG